MSRADDRARVAAPVVIAGAGPVGLALALGLSRHGVHCIVLEREASTSEHSKAAVIHVRTREVLRQWGVEDPFLAAGVLHPSITLHRAADDHPRATLDLRRLTGEAEEPGLLLLEQSQTERLLLDELRRSGHADVRFGTEVCAVSRDDPETGGDGVRLTVRTRDGEDRLDAAYVVGCDGAASSVRGLIGLPFRGSTYRIRPMLADVWVDDLRDRQVWPRQHDGPDGVTTAIRLRPRLWRIIGVDGPGSDGASDTLRVDDAEVDRRAAEVLGPGPVEVVWASRFRIHRRCAPRFRRGRVLLAGDAAHVHSPLGGLGMNAGIQDAHNLAWKLAAALEGGDAERLLASYDVERRAVVGQVSRGTDIATRLFLRSPPVVRDRSVDLLGRVMQLDPVRRRGLRTLAMIDLDYPGSPLLDPAHRSAGSRLPDPVLIDPTGNEVRLHRLLPPAAALLIAVTSNPGDVPIGPDATPEASARPGSVPEPATLHVGPNGHRDPSSRLRGLLGDGDGWILVRPDGHVAWSWSGPDRPEPAWIAWSLGRGDRLPRDPSPDRAPRTLRGLVREVRERTALDLPHVR